MTPCILPWINFGTNTFGRARPCGYSALKSETKLRDSSIGGEWNSEYFREIRREFVAGRWPKNCSRCEYVESMGGKSKKQTEHNHMFSDYKSLLDQTFEDGSVPYFPPHIDIRVGTICNLKCIHCGTGASSKWSEDKSLINKYPNTEEYSIDNKWIEQESTVWDSVFDNIDQVKRLNFLGGEPFANKQHNRFIDRIVESGHSGNITLFYVTNGTLITPKMMDKLLKFKKVLMQVSIDAAGAPAEYFRFPIKWDHYVSQLDMLNEYSLSDNLLLKAQWTCSNVSMFYLSDTYRFIADRYRRMEFDFCNHVEWPAHMSAQNLPTPLKHEVAKKIESMYFGVHNGNEAKVKFYVKHMLERDLWLEHGETFLRYLDDLDAARNVSWKESLSELHREMERCR